MKLKPIPMTYRGVRFRSTLEADWAATLDTLDIVWQYEPEGVLLPSGPYLPDFYLPEIATWLEVKGPGVPGAEKVAELAEAIYDENESQHVILARAPIAGMTDWKHLGEWSEDGSTLQRCPTCSHWWWCTRLGLYGCRAHRRSQSGDDDLQGETYRAASDKNPYDEPMPFARAPRPERGTSGQRAH